MARITSSRQHLNGNVQANYYTQSYFGQTYTGTYLSGNVNYGRKLFDMFTFSAGIVDSSTGLGNNNVGFIGTVNYFRRFGEWETSGSFNYAQNVQSLLVTETTSYYNYNANIHRKFSSRVQWTAAFNGSRQGLSSDKNSVEQQRRLRHQPELAPGCPQRAIPDGDGKLDPDQHRTYCRCRHSPE